MTDFKIPEEEELVVRKQAIKRVISVRMTDEEMEDLQWLIDRRKSCATQILREAFAQFSEQWALGSTKERAAG